MVSSVLTRDRLEGLMQNADDESSTSAHFNRSDRSFGLETSGTAARSAPVVDPDDRHPLTGRLTSTQKNRITQLLGTWEEPTIAEKVLVSTPSIAVMLLDPTDLLLIHDLSLVSLTGTRVGERTASVQESPCLSSY